MPRNRPLNADLDEEARPEQEFERHYRNMRLPALALEQPQLDADAEEELTARAAHRLTVAGDVAPYAAPDPYAAGIKALQPKEPR